MKTITETADLTPETLSARLNRGEPLQIIDVRTPGEFAGGRIAGAKLIPLAELGARLPEISREISLVCVCQSGGRSARASEQLRRASLPAYNLTGGMTAWTRAGLPTERDAHAPWSLERQVRLVAGSLVLIGVILGWTVHPGFFGLSAFVGAGLAFAGLTDWCGLGLLLARAPWNRRAS